MSRILLPEVEVLITTISYKCRWGLTGFYPTLDVLIAIGNAQHSSKDNTCIPNYSHYVLILTAWPFIDTCLQIPCTVDE